MLLPAGPNRFVDKYASTPSGEEITDTAAVPGGSFVRNSSLHDEETIIMKRRIKTVKQADSFFISILIW